MIEIHNFFIMRSGKVENFTADGPKYGWHKQFGQNIIHHAFRTGSGINDGGAFGTTGANNAQKINSHLQISSSKLWDAFQDEKVLEENQNYQFNLENL